MATLAASMCAACARFPDSDQVRTVIAQPTIPAIARTPCAAPVPPPDRKLTAGETFDLWSRDRVSLRECETKRRAAVNAIGEAQ